MQVRRSGFHPSKEGFKVSYNARVIGQAAVSIPLRKVSRLGASQQLRLADTVSIPLRKVSRLHGGYQDISGKFVSIPLRKVSRDGERHRNAYTTPVSIPLRKVSRRAGDSERKGHYRFPSL